MLAAEPKVEEVEIPLLEGACYSLTTSSTHRRRFQLGHRARFWIAEPGGLPCEFDYVDGGVRLRLKKDGPMQCKLAFKRSFTRSVCDVCYQRYFYPVRVIAMNPVTP